MAKKMMMAVANEIVKSKTQKYFMLNQINIS